MSLALSQIPMLSQKHRREKENIQGNFTHAFFPIIWSAYYMSSIFQRYFSASDKIIHSRETCFLSLRNHYAIQVVRRSAYHLPLIYITKKVSLGFPFYPTNLVPFHKCSREKQTEKCFSVRRQPA